MSEIIYPFPKANPRHRLAASILDGVLAFFTLGIGWFIWSLIVWGRGQTPGKQLVKLRVYGKSTGQRVRWWQMLFRQYLVLIGIPLLLFIFFYAIDAIHYWRGDAGILGFQFSNLNGPWFAAYGTTSGVFTFKNYAYICLMLCYLLPIVDALWIFKSGKRNRLVDLISKTDVLNEAVPRLSVVTEHQNMPYIKNPYTISELETESKVTREIREATEMFQNGLIDDEEFAALKQKIIANN